MLASIGAWLLSKVMGLASSGLIDKALDFFGKTQDKQLRKDELTADVTKAAMQAYIEGMKVEADVSKTKLTMPIYWICVLLFVLPLGVWWSCVITDSIFHLGWKVANLPTAEMRSWAGDMIKFLFYSGGTVLGLKALMSK